MIWPVSRVLFTTAIYLGAMLPLRSSHLSGNSRASLVPIAVLLRIEFTGLRAFTRQPVSSYLAFPPLPPGRQCTIRRACKLKKVDIVMARPEAVYLCCTFPVVAYGGRYPLSLPYGARTFLTRGLSAHLARLSGQVTAFIILYFSRLVKQIAKIPVIV